MLVMKQITHLVKHLIYPSKGRRTAGAADLPTDQYSINDAK